MEMIWHFANMQRNSHRNLTGAFGVRLHAQRRLPAAARARRRTGAPARLVHDDHSPLIILAGPCAHSVTVVWSVRIADNVDGPR
jgi:hypothetical protein